MCLRLCEFINESLFISAHKYQAGVVRQKEDLSPCDEELAVDEKGCVEGLLLAGGVWVTDILKCQPVKEEAGDHSDPDDHWENIARDADSIVISFNQVVRENVLDQTHN